MERSGLVNLGQGTVMGSLSPTCQPQNGSPTMIEEGEMAEALVQLGRVLRASSYYQRAGNFLRYTIDPGRKMTASGVLREQCEDVTPNCAGERHQLNATSRKGIFVLAMADWAAASGSSEFRPFLHDQVRSLLEHDVWAGRSSGCRAGHACQFGFSWVGGVPKMLVSVGTQESAVDAFTAVLR